MAMTTQVWVSTVNRAHIANIEVVDGDIMETSESAKRRLSASIDEQSEVPATKRRLVESSGNNDSEKTVIDLTMSDLLSSPTPSGSIDAAPAVTLRGSSPLAYGSEGEEEEAHTTLDAHKPTPDSIYS